MNLDGTFTPKGQAPYAEVEKFLEDNLGIINHNDGKAEPGFEEGPNTAMIPDVLAGDVNGFQGELSPGTSMGNQQEAMPGLKEVDLTTETPMANVEATSLETLSKAVIQQGQMLDLGDEGFSHWLLNRKADFLG